MKDVAEAENIKITNLKKWMSSFRRYDRDDTDTYRNLMEEKKKIEAKAKKGDQESIDFLGSIGMVVKTQTDKHSSKLYYAFEEGIMLWSLYGECDYNGKAKEKTEVAE